MSTQDIFSSQNIFSSEAEVLGCWHNAESSSSEVMFCGSEGENFWCDIDKAKKVCDIIVRKTGDVTAKKANDVQSNKGCDVLKPIKRNVFGVQKVYDAQVKKQKVCDESKMTEKEACVGKTGYLDKRGLWDSYGESISSYEDTESCDNIDECWLNRRNLWDEDLNTNRKEEKLDNDSHGEEKLDAKTLEKNSEEMNVFDGISDENMNLYDKNKPLIHNTEAQDVLNGIYTRDIKSTYQKLDTFQLPSENKRITLNGSQKGNPRGDEKVSTSEITSLGVNMKLVDVLNSSASQDKGPDSICCNSEFKNTVSSRNNWRKEPSKVHSVPAKPRDHLINFWSNFYNGEVRNLPCLGAGKADSINRISVDVVKELLDGLHNLEYLIIDCRFPYEYEGGHIKGAVNISTLSETAVLFHTPKTLIFHCEFSSVMAPKLAQYVRNMDRNRNTYPELTLPEIYVMEGGYKAFYRAYPGLCVPERYVTMDDARYRDICIKEQNKRRTDNKKFR